MNDVISRQGTIDRQDTIDRINEYIEEYSEIDSDGNHSEKWCAMQEAKMTIENMPSAQPKAIRPKFVAEDRYRKDYFQTFPHCPKCNYELETGDCYCRVCGCHIDWSEDDE